MCCVTFAHLNHIETSEATTPPADDPPAEVANTSGEDAKVETEEEAAANEPVSSAEGEGAPDGAATEPPAEGADPEKVDEGAASAEDENTAKPNDEDGSNGEISGLALLYAVKLTPL